MNVITDAIQLNERIALARSSSLRVGFVPTMGYLHPGHLSLIRKARERCNFIVVSIFVNPLQFNQQEDFQNYPIDLDRDIALLAELEVDLLFVPNQKTIYSPNHQTRVSLSEISQLWEGACRPGHFDGVATVVTILINLVQPHQAVFGEKDFQQLRLIEQMVSDLHMPVEIVRSELVRENDGLAMSSRNVRLAPAAREQALSLSRALSIMRQKALAGEVRSEPLIAEAKTLIAAQTLAQLDYLAIIEPVNLQPVARLEQDETYRAIVAATFGGIRLIDNMQLSCTN